MGLEGKNALESKPDWLQNPPPSALTLNKSEISVTSVVKNKVPSGMMGFHSVLSELPVTLRSLASDVSVQARSRPYGLCSVSPSFASPSCYRAWHGQHKEGHVLNRHSHATESPELGAFKVRKEPRVPSKKHHHVKTEEEPRAPIRQHKTPPGRASELHTGKSRMTPGTWRQWGDTFIC